MKTMTVETLLDLLTDVNPRFTVSVNRVGNLAILDEHNEYIGYIDFKTNEVCWNK